MENGLFPRGLKTRHGCSLRCEVRIEHLYGHDNELLIERYTIVRVVEVLENRYYQVSFLDDQSNS